MQTIILTGSNGLMGQKVVQLLRNRPDVRLIATAKGESRMKTTTGYEYLSLDLTDAEGWQTCFETYSPDVVIHAGAMTQVDHCEDRKEECDSINVTAVQILVNLCEKFETHLVHISTDFVFDGEQPDGYYHENDTPNPVNYYGLSKWKAEQIVQASRAKWAILRTVLVYGVVEGLSRTNIVLWVKNSLEKQKAITVVSDQMRCPTFAEDLAAGAVAAATRKAEGIFHICGPEKMTILALAHRIADFWKLDKNLISPIDSPSLNQRAKRPPRTAFHLNKAQTILDYHPRNLEDSFQILTKQLAEISS